MTRLRSFFQQVAARLRPLFDTETKLRRWYIASLVCNMGIIVTGAVVRLTGSGLGCPTWPRCTEDSFVPHPEMGIHGIIEFGNRLLTFVLIIAALGAFIATWVNRGRGSKLWWLTLGIGLGIPGQGVVGGITVLTDLNPWVVAFHLLLSVVLIVLCVWALILARPASPDPVTPLTRSLVLASFITGMAAIWIGTVVTGAGPHAGDADAVRNGLDIHAWSRYHGISAWVFCAASLAALVALWRHSRSRRAGLVLLATILFQGAVGYIQYFNGLPIGVVALHMLGLTFVTAASAWLLFTSVAAPATAAAPAQHSDFLHQPERDLTTEP